MCVTAPMRADFLRPVPAILAVVGLACARSAVPVADPPADNRPRLVFVAQSDSFTAAAAEYTAIWTSDGARIVRAMETATGLAFADTAVRAIVYEGISRSGYRDRPMRLRASYAHDTKRATLIHELGHRLQSPLFRATDEEHPQLFLWLYDVWVALYGREFADAQVAVEKRRGGVYPEAWDRALALTAGQRAQQWREILSSRGPDAR